MAAAPRDIDALVGLSDALTQQVDADETRTPVADDADEPIELLRVAAELAVEHPQLRAAILADLGQKLTWRFGVLLDKDPTQEDQLKQQLDEAIRCHRRALDSAAEAGVTEEFISIELEAVLQLVDLLRLRFTALGELGELSAAIGYQKQILGVLDEDDEDRPEVLYRLGLDYATRHDQQTETAQQDQERAIACLRELRGLIGDDYPARQELATLLGLILGYRVLEDVAESSDEDFAEAVAELTLARQAPVTEDDASDVVSVRFRLGMVRAFRYLNRGGDADDLEVALAELGELADHPDTPKDQADRCHLTLAMLEYLRTAPVELRRGPELFAADGKTRLREVFAALITARGADTGHAVRRHLDAISESSAADPQLSMLVRGLRTGTFEYSDTKDEGSRTAELNDAVAWLDDADPEFTALGAPVELTVLQANARAAIAHQSGDRAAAIIAADQVAESVAALDEDHPLRTLTHDLLSTLIGGIAPAGSAAESSAAIATMERLLTELPDDHPDRARALTKASALLFNSMAQNRSAVSFDRVRDMLTRATERAAADDINESLNHFLLGGLNGLQGTFEHDMVMLNSGVDLLKKAMGKVPEGHPLHSMIGPALGTLLYGRALLGGDLENYDAAEFYSAELVQADEGPELTEQRRTMRALGDYLAAGAKLARNRHNLDATLLDEAIGQMTTAAEQLSDDSLLRQQVSSNIDGLRITRDAYQLAGHDVDLASADSERLRAGVDALLAKARDTPEERFDHVSDTGIAAMALVGRAFLVRDLSALDRGISMLGKLCATPELFPHELLSILSCLSMSLRLRYQHFRRPRDLNNAIDRLEQAELLIQQNPPGGADVAPILHLLGDCYHERADPLRRDRQRAVDAGMQALRERANDVLLQNNSERALNTAIATSGEAADVARWCITAGRDEAAVHALELGRAIVLHFVTIDAGVPALLREGGYADLAAEWEAEPDRASGAVELPWNLGNDAKDQDRRARAAAEMMTNLSEVAVPGDLRHRVLEAVEGTETYVRLLDPPAVADITAALTATGSSALVYLLPAHDLHPGLAMIVHADGTVQPRELPGLRCGAGTVFDAFSQAQHVVQTAAPKSAEEARARQHWTSRLNEVCDWAWTSAMAEVLAVLGNPQGGRPARLVLVPVGELGMVPWHAARRGVPGGELRHACQDAVITYAASARQFVDTSRRRKLPWTSTPAVVRVSDGLFFASEETEEIHRHFYPKGIYLGARRNRRSRATATSVRDLLPSKYSAGASLLHLGCHAFLDNPPLDSFLKLAGNSTLYVRDILEQTRNRPVDAEGGLVILAACASDLTSGAYDEALTLATAFLAAGSVGVMGAKWAVDDGPTALFMVMFHHYLNSGYNDPATALRAAQRWMLDRRRKLPRRIGHRLADELTQLDLTETASWAAFTYQGR
ncbi:MAG: CHAT domain-containing protein [Actinomycetota bacterium]|nr:CHAT domain-containing protein [Actinomycetota bacterium]